jgi:ATP-dependent NAD(P)H-hydrate dehydratase
LHLEFFIYLYWLFCDELGFVVGTLQDYPAPLVLTPNAPEFERLVQALKDTDQGGVARTLGVNTVVLRKGYFDLVEGALGEKVECSAPGSWRRCGGQGDLLSGSLGTFLAWELYQQVPRQQTGILAAYAACRLTRELAKRAFEKRGRSMCASDMLLEIHDAFAEIFGQ